MLSSSHSDVDGWLEKLKVDKKFLEEKDLQILCSKVKELLSAESTVQPVKAPVTVCGDIHGQFYDLLELFKTGGELPFSNYIFMGDFVDRGYHSVETIEYLLCLKLRYPGQITLLRGNHECRSITKVYGFYDEILSKYGSSNPWELFMDVFDHFPLAAMIDEQILCIHSGLSPDLKSIDQIRTIQRQQEIPTEGIFCDLLCSDPDDIDGWKINPRGGGWLFGAEPTKIFSHANNLQLICRSHQVAEEGYKYWFAEKNLVTVWSLPNYCYKLKNIASILAFDENLNREFKLFNESSDISKLIKYQEVAQKIL